MKNASKNVVKIAEYLNSNYHSLKPEDAVKLHPYAYERMEKFKAQIAQEVPQITTIDSAQFEKDATSYLSEEEIKSFGETWEKIETWIMQCLDTDLNYSSPFSETIDLDLATLKGFLRSIYKRKEAATKKESLKALVNERAQQIEEGLPAIIEKAKIYLSAVEFENFKKSIKGMIIPFLCHGAEFGGDIGAYEYVCFTSTIQQREAQKEQQKAAEAQAASYNQSLWQEIKKLQSVLCKKKDVLQYFKQNVCDPRYLGNQLHEIFNWEKLQTNRNAVLRINGALLDGLITENIKEFTERESNVYFFFLPSASYCFEEMPSLHFTFDIFAVTGTEIRIKPVEKIINDYKFVFPWKDPEASFSNAPLEGPIVLGYNYHVVNSLELGALDWQLIPLSLVHSLFGSGTEPEETTIKEANKDAVIYEVEGWEDEVYIPTSFAEYIKKLGSIEKMIEVGIIPEKAADIIMGKIDQLGEKSIASKLEHAIVAQAAIGMKMTGKAKLFVIFSQGKGPSSPEAKGIGLHKSTRFKYYNEFLKQSHIKP